MNAKKIDKIAIGTLYVIAGIIVTILAALILTSWFAEYHTSAGHS